MPFGVIPTSATSLLEKTIGPMIYRFQSCMRRLSMRPGSPNSLERDHRVISRERRGENHLLSLNFYRDKTIGGALLKDAPPLFTDSLLVGGLMSKVFAEEELSKFSGKDGSSILIACDGKVYDVTKSYHWRSGRHHALHQAGQDLTEVMEKSPHAVDLLQRFPIVGILKKRSFELDPQ